MKIVRNNDSNFEKYWEIFVKENKNVGPFYSLITLKQWLEFGKEYSAENKSFIILNESKPAAIVPLILEKDGGSSFFSAGLGFGAFYGPLVSCLFGSKLRKRIRSFVFQEIDELAKKFNIVKVMISIHPFTFFNEKEYYNYLTKYSFLDASCGTKIIDLKTDWQLLCADRRKHCKALVNKGMRVYDFFVMNSENAGYELHEVYRLLHAKAAGRVTRSKRTFDLQFEALKKGEATLIGAKYRGKIVQINYYDHCNGYVYYSSSADDPEFDRSDVPISHSLIWYSIQWFRNNGYGYFEMGDQIYDSQVFLHPSKKEISIAYFKGGFGGVTVPLFRGVKYYNADYMRADMEKQFHKLLKSIHI